jgi:hypothetical protein
LKKITESQKQVLSQLVFVESYDSIASETGAHHGALRDDLIQLINAGLIEVFDNNLSQRLNAYDSDNLHQFSFRATNSGLKSL